MTEDYTDEQWESLYEQTVDNVECLRSEGFDLESVPSAQRFRESDGFWNVYDELIKSGAMAAAALIDYEPTCPQPSQFP